MRWVFSDGTVYEGGQVQGDSKLADAIRFDIARVKAGSGVPVQIEVCPCPPSYMDNLDDPQMVNEWLFAFTYNWRFDGIKLVSAPELEPIERFVTTDPDDPPDTIY